MKNKVVLFTVVACASIIVTAIIICCLRCSCASDVTEAESASSVSESTVAEQVEEVADVVDGTAVCGDVVFDKNDFDHYYYTYSLEDFNVQELTDILSMCARTGGYAIDLDKLPVDDTYSKIISLSSDLGGVTLRVGYLDGIVIDICEVNNFTKAVETLTLEVTNADSNVE